MRKKLALMISCVCLALSATAQNEGGNVLTQRSSTPQTTGNTGKSIAIKSKSYNYELSVGLHAGAGLAMASDGDLKFTDGSGFSYNAGLAANVRFGGKDSKGRALNGQGLFGIGLELNYAGYSVKTVADDNLNLGYFEVPVLLQFYPAYQTKQLKNLYIEVGPTFSAIVSKSPDMIKVDPETSLVTGDLKGGDVKGTIGVGYRFNAAGANDGFYVNLRYNHGFSKLAGNVPTKLSSAEFTIGYLFKCVGGKGKGNSNNKTTPNRNVLR